MKEILFQAYFRCLRHSSRKNEKKIHRTASRSWIGSSEKATECEKWTLRALHIERLKQRLDKPIDCDINAQFILYFPKTIYNTKKNVRSKSIGDLSNLIQGPEDCLQIAKIIENDTLVCGYDGSRRKYIDGSDYFIKIVLTKYEAEENENS